MPLTPNTSATAYLPVTECVKRVDQRTVGDWCSDNGTRVTPSELLTDPNLAAALLSASGMLESAILKAERYEPDDIAALIATPSAGQAYIYEVLTRLTEGLLWQRRPSIAPYPPLFDWAMDQLEQLGNGSKILPFAETQDAGLPAHHVDVEADVQGRRLVVTQARRFYGRRGFDLNG